MHSDTLAIIDKLHSSTYDFVDMEQMIAVFILDKNELSHFMH